ncbi:MAG: diguanylate cyclase [Planctomycetes bacterium]|nr:diguanylate cyclase [Planctomycetota bacterium]
MESSGYVLLVDDDPTALKLLTKVMSRNDYQVLTSTSAEEARAKIEKFGQEVETIILDLAMPGEMDGHGLCKWLQEQPSPRKEIPIIVLSVKSSPEDMAKSYECGAFQHIAKPYNAQHLLSVVDSVIRMKHASETARAMAEKYAAIVENAPVGVLIVDSEFNVLEMSRVLSERYAKENSGEPFKTYELLYNPPRTKPDPEMPLAKALQSGKISRDTVRLKEAGNLVWWDMSAAPLTDKQGQITGAVLIMHDVTHEREMEQKLRDEAERNKKAEEEANQNAKRLREVMAKQDDFTDLLMDAQREARQQRDEAEQAKQKLEEANVQLEKLSITDPLTGLYNRRRFFNAFGQEIIRATRYHHPLSLIMLDIDLFKNVNDTYGHPVGDEVLRGMAAILNQQVRETDILARYGGEEFVMMLSETEAESAKIIAERLRQNIESAVFIKNKPELRITVSMGVSSQKGTLEPNAILAAADEALYQAKRSGRNCVVFKAAQAD